MLLDEKLWVLDKSETLALSGWLTQAETIRREMNRLVFDHWEKVKSEKALSKSILRRYVGYWNTHRALLDKEAIGVHSGTYAEELIASIVRAKVKYVQRDLKKDPKRALADLQIYQNRWDKVAKREPDICIIRQEKTILVIEVKSVLTNEEWRRTRQIKAEYQRLPDASAYWLVALRANGLAKEVTSAVDMDPTCCVLYKGPTISERPEESIEIWKPVEDWLDLMMSSFSTI